MPQEIKAAWGGPMTSVIPESSTGSTEASKESSTGLKDENSLGDLNPLLHKVDLSKIMPLRIVAESTLRKHGGIIPMMESVVVFNPPDKLAPRFVAKFKADDLSEKQISLLEDLVRQTYKISVRTRTDSSGKDVPVEDYPVTTREEAARTNSKGWYMGPDISPTNSHHMGLFLFKDFGEVNKENFAAAPQSTGKFTVEIRDAMLHQTDLVEFVTQVGSILGQGEMIDHGDLLYEIYYDLMRMALKKVDQESVYGMEDILAQIKRGLILPLASPDLSQGIEQQPESVIMVGVPGTGKTLVVERLLSEDTGLFILSLDPMELRKELEMPKEKQTLLPRIAEVAQSTGRSVILHVDDIENMIGDDRDANRDTNSTLRNLMAGVRDSGFHLIASANVPEKIDEALLQPQRLGLIIHCGLQDERARFEILKIHATSKSKELGQSLFGSGQEREIILREVVKHTEYFTPRFLAEIATVAKSYLLERVATETGKQMRLTEDDLDGHVFIVNDWERAYSEVSSRYNKREVRERDEELQNFVSKHRRKAVGFGSNNLDPYMLFSKDAHEKLAAARSNTPLVD